MTRRHCVWQCGPVEKPVLSPIGYRRLGLLLARQGIRLNHKKLYRLYKEERLSVRKRGGRKRALGTRAPMSIPQDANLRWSLDFVMDTLVNGRASAS
jgi:putative transposase